MLKKLLMAVCFSVLAIASQADEGQKINSKVQRVVVFLSGAQVTRTADVSIAGGVSMLVFGNISPNIDVQSIQVSGSGDFTILSVKQEYDYLNLQQTEKRVIELRIQQKAISEKIDLKNASVAILEQEAEMLKKNQIVSGENTGLDIMKLKQALDFQTERLTEIKSKEQALTDEIEQLNKEVQQYNKQIADLTRGSVTATSNILVTVSSKTQLQSKFKLSYVVSNAGWFPTYDIRARDVNSPIDIFYKANVSQKCGEDWTNIRLTLSTGNPSVSGTKPYLSPYFLNFGMTYTDLSNQISNSNRQRVTGRVIASDDGLPLPGATVKVKGTSIGTQTNSSGNYSIELPPGSATLVYSVVGYTTQQMVVNSPVINVSMQASATSLQEVVVTTSLGIDHSASELGYSASVIKAKQIPVEDKAPEVNMVENQTNVEFDIADPYSIPSDGKQYTVDINRLELNASYQYAVIPKISTDVFLTAKLTDWNKYNFLSGEANLFFEGTFIGKSLINSNATTDTLNLSLGTDKNIVVTRTSLKNLTEKQSLGSNRKESRDWQIEVKNRKNQVINLLVEDQVPVSQNSSIEVEKQELSGGKLDDKSGKVSWDFQLNPQDDKKVELKYMVKYPKNQSVIVQ